VYIFIFWYVARIKIWQPWRETDRGGGEKKRFREFKENLAAKNEINRLIRDCGSENLKCQKTDIILGPMLLFQK
jgi:hypothetical protein